MNNHITLSLVFLMGLSINAQTINLSGRVTNQAANPVSNAIVTLLHQGLKDTTGADGNFTLTKTSTAALQTGIAQTETMTIENGMVRLALSNASPVKIDVYDLHGNLLKQVRQHSAPAGLYCFNVSENCKAATVLVINACIGQNSAAFRYFPLNSGKVTGNAAAQTLQRTESGLTKVTAINDTLTVNATGFKPKAVALSFYNQIINVTLDSAGGFPRADADPTFQSVSGLGPYQYLSYSSGFKIVDSTYSSATIFYPTTAQPPFAAMAFCPGCTEVESDFLTWGKLLASHGFVVLILTPLNTVFDLPEVRGDQLLAALNTLVSENTRTGGPLNGKIATNRLGVMGHSMGGGGTLYAGNKNSSRIKAAIALMPWQPLGSFPNCTAPTLVVAAENDILVDHVYMAYPEYESLGAKDKVYMEVAGADHTSANDISGGGNLYARYGVSWLKVHLENDQRYAQFLSGAPHQTDVATKLFAKYEP